MSSFQRAFPTLAKLFERRQGKRDGSAPPGPAAEPPPDGPEPQTSEPARAPRQPRRRRSPATVVGLDIDPGHVIAAQVKVGDSVQVERAAGRPLPLEVFRDGEVVDPAALTEALRELFRDSGLGTRVRIGLANQRIMVRTIELPPIPDRKELAAAVRFRAADEIPMPLDSVVLDHQTLELVETPGGIRQRVLIVAARREMVERMLAAVEAAGLRPEGIDLSAFALIRALRAPGGDERERVLYVSFAGLTNIALAEGPTCIFTRVLSVGLESLIAEVAERSAISFGEARALVREVGLEQAATSWEPETTPLEPVAEGLGEARTAPDEVGMPGVPSAPGPDADEPVLEQAPAEPELAPPAPPATIADAAPTSRHAGIAPLEDRRRIDATAEQREIVRIVLSDGVRQIAAEIANSLAYHAGAGGQAPLDRIVASGPATEIPGFLEALQGELHEPITEATVAASSADHGDVPLSRLAVAAGLAIEEAPG